MAAKLKKVGTDKTREEALVNLRSTLEWLGEDVHTIENEVDLIAPNIAARLESQAPRGGVMTSDVVYNQVTGKVGVTFIDAGEVELKNIDRPLRVRLSWADAEALDRVLAPLLAQA